MGTVDSLTTRLSVLPLTTIFTPPSSCLAPTYTFGQDSINITTIQYTITRKYDAACYPSDLRLAGQLVGGKFAMTSYLPFFSPGVCPSGYEANTQPKTQTQEEDEVTFAVCCPSHAHPVTYSLCTWPEKWLVTIVEGGQISTAFAELTATGFPIGWQAKDVSLWEHPTSTSTSGTQKISALSTFSATTTTSAISQTSSGSSQLPTSSRKVSDTLSKGEIAGIAVGAAVSAVLLSLMILWLWMRRQKQAEQAVNASSTPPEEYTGKAELAGEGKSLGELHDENLEEMNDTSRPNEVGETIRAELDSDWRGWEVPSPM